MLKPSTLNRTFEVLKGRFILSSPASFIPLNRTFEVLKDVLVFDVDAELVALNRTFEVLKVDTNCRSTSLGGHP